MRKWKRFAGLMSQEGKMRGVKNTRRLQKQQNGDLLSLLERLRVENPFKQAINPERRKKVFFLIPASHAAVELPDPSLCPRPS